jgi:hypothetical protein
MNKKTRDKISKSHMGLKHSPETRAKMSKSAKRAMTPERRKALSDLRKKEYALMSPEERQRIFGKNKLKPSNKTNTNYWRHRIKCLNKYNIWRRSVLSRDNNKCTLCDNNNDLVVHHIYPIKSIVKDNLSLLQTGNFDIPILWDINNGVTRCKNCHKTIDHKRVSKKSKLKILLNAVIKEPISKDLKTELIKYMQSNALWKD